MEKNIFITEENGLQDKSFVAGDIVRMYKEGTDISYPCVILECEKLEMFRVQMIKGVVETANLLSSSAYTIYIGLEGKLIATGVLPANKLRVLMGTAFDSFTRKVFLDENTMIEGDLIYALCVSNNIE